MLYAIRRLLMPGYFGRVGGRHIPNGIFWCSGDEDDKDSDNDSVTGPFKTEAALNEAFPLQSIQIAEFNGRKGRRGGFYRRMLPKVLKDDFQRKNIVISRRRPVLPPPKTGQLSDDCPDGGFEVVLID